MNVNEAIDDLYAILGQHNGEYMDYASYEAAVDNLNIISNFVTGTRWISMNDHLPDDSELVMLFAPAGTYTNFDWYDFGIYNKASNSFYALGFRFVHSAQHRPTGCRCQILHRRLSDAV